MGLKVDFHIHSWHSDGTMGPVAIVDKYVEDEYDLIAITDHEIIGDIEEAVTHGETKNIRVIQGIEIPTDYKGEDLHILGYYFDTENEELLDELDNLLKIRKSRNKKILEILNASGYDIEAKDLPIRKGQKYIGKPNFARALVKKGYISEFKEAFEPGKFLEVPEIKAIPHEKMTTQRAIELINNAGGIAVLAHPYRMRTIGERGSKEWQKNFTIMIKELKALGLKGIECMYPKHTKEEEFFFINTAAKFHMHILEGSDFHGDGDRK